MADVVDDFDSAGLLRRVFQTMSNQVAGRSAAALLPGDEYLPTTTADPAVPAPAPAPAPVSESGPAPAPSGSHLEGVPATGDVGALMRAMTSGVESHGSPDATNGRTGAHGAWQIMPDNWPSWARAAGVDVNDQSYAAQAKVTAHVMQGYLDTLGSIEAVAVAWYGGPAAAKAWLKNPNAPRFNKRPAKNEPSINEYVAKIRAAMGAN